MKSYGKFTLYVLLFIMLHATRSHAQSFVAVGPSISAGSTTFPVNGRRGIGGGVEFVHNIFKHGGIRLSVGYDYFKNRYPKSASEDSLLKLEAAGRGTNTLLPVRVGYQHFLYKDLAFIYGEAGVAVLHRPTRYHRSEYTKSLFTYALGIGHRFTVRNNQVIQLSLSYNYNKLFENRNLNYFSFKTAYGLVLNRG